MISAAQAPALSFFELAPELDRIVRLLEFWPDDYPAPAWRAHLTEPLLAD